MISGPQGKKTVKTINEEECNTIFELVGSIRISQDEVEALKGVLRLVLAQWCKLKKIDGIWNEMIIKFLWLQSSDL